MSSAPITDYTTLQAAIIDWSKRNDLAGSVPQFIALAEAQMQRRLDSMDGNTQIAVTIPGAEPDANYWSLPADFSQMNFCYIDLGLGQKQVLDQHPANQLEELNTTGRMGMPQGYAIVGLGGLPHMKFDRTPDATYTLAINYRAQFTPLSLANPSNWLLREHPDLYLFCSLMQTAPYLKQDARLATWAAMLEGSPDNSTPGIWDQIKKMDRQKRWGLSAPKRRPTTTIRDGYSRRLR